MVMDLAPRLSVDIASAATLALIRRALVQRSQGAVRSARRYLKALAVAGIDVDLSASQEAYFSADEHDPLPKDLTELGRDLGMAVVGQ